jgi:hypothetical protein
MANSLARYPDHDGRFYAKGCYIKRKPVANLRHDTTHGPCVGITMGWTVAEAAFEEAAIAIAEAMNVKYADEIAAARAQIDEAIALGEAEKS